MKPRRQLWVVALGLFVLAACTSSRRPAANDGQTHWMRQCRSDAQCGSLECLCGVCAASCDDDAQCHGALGESAACVIATESVREARCGADAPAGGLCLPQCDGNADCEAIDARLVCEDSVCYSTSTPVPPALDGAVGDASSKPNPTGDASRPQPSFDAAVVDAAVADASDPPIPDAGDLERPDGSVVPDASVEIVRSLEDGELFCADLLRGADIVGLRVVHDVWIEDFEFLGSDLYYGTYRPGGPQGTTGVIRHIDANGDEVEIIAARRGAQEIEIEGDELVWAESDGLSVEIHSRPIAGGPIADLGPPSAPYANVWGMVLDSDEAFWFSDGMVLRSDRTPRATMALVSDATAANTIVNTLLADETYLYYLEGDYPAGPRTIHRVPKDGSAAPTDFLAGSMPFRFGLASGYLYFSEPGIRDQFGNHDGNGRIVRRELEGTELATIAASEAEPLALAVDDTDVYWIEVGATLDRTELWRAPNDGSGQPERLLTSDLAPWPEGLVTLKLTEDEIYWTANCSVGNDSDYFLLGMAKP